VAGITSGELHHSVLKLFREFEKFGSGHASFAGDIGCPRATVSWIRSGLWEWEECDCVRMDPGGLDFVREEVVKTPICEWVLKRYDEYHLEKWTIGWRLLRPPSHRTSVPPITSSFAAWQSVMRYSNQRERNGGTVTAIGNKIFNSLFLAKKYSNHID
jgi:hypothetical protein